MPHPLIPHLASLRQAIETVNSQLDGHLQIEHNRAKSVVGLCARVQAKLTAQTLGVCLNVLSDQPFLALKALALI